jgi:hypothetical protein
MSLKKDYLGINKIEEGYGGWKCRCCNPFSMEPRKMKPLARRIMRHVSKRNWKKEIQIELGE